MPSRNASAVWNGELRDGAGKMKLGGGAYEGPYTFSSRFEEGAGTNPEELIAAAHAGCFSMFLSKVLAEAGHAPESIETTATAHLTKDEVGFAISRIDLRTVGQVAGVSGDEFAKHAETAKAGCPISRTLANVEITVSATLA
ncbi:MAG: OsmC family protein [Micromonosporaceae bacterium]